ncbi:hypothetical protein [Flavobacterium anhuiense]|uniref:hypothetical protein n=1 Tax=Flavobacterium anhuiense TaxID=459526 RepID=UPI003D95CF93
MKKFLLLFLVLTSAAYAQSKKQILVGRWNAIDSNGQSNKMIFTSDNFISMTINGEFINGEGFQVKEGKNKGQKGFLKYEIDESKVPITLDIIASSLEKGKTIEKGRILAIVEFKSNDEIKFNISLEGKRATSFNSSNEETTIVLKRDK